MGVRVKKGEGRQRERDPDSMKWWKKRGERGKKKSPVGKKVQWDNAIVGGKGR